MASELKGLSIYAGRDSAEHNHLPPEKCTLRRKNNCSGVA